MTANNLAAKEFTDDQSNTADGSSFSDDRSNNADLPNKFAWKELSNSDVDPIMGGGLWPSLSETAMISSSSRSNWIESVHVTQETKNPNAPQDQVAIVNLNPTPRHGVPARQRYTRRGAGHTSNGSHTHNGFVHPTASSLPPSLPYAHMPIMAFVTPSNAPVNDHFSQRNPSPRLHHYNNYNGIYDHGRRSFEFNSQSCNGGDLQMQHQRGPPKGLMSRPPLPSSSAFIPSTHVTPMPPLGFSGQNPIYMFPRCGTPYVTDATPPSLYIPSPDISLPTLLVKQIDFYFSDVNLLTDDYLKLKMDEDGWVSITVIANFPRVMKLTHDNNVILEALKASLVVEIKDEKIRKRNGWMKYLAPKVQVDTELETSA